MPKIRVLDDSITKVSLGEEEFTVGENREFEVSQEIADTCFLPKNRFLVIPDSDPEEGDEPSGEDGEGDQEAPSTGSAAAGGTVSSSTVSSAAADKKK